MLRSYQQKVYDELRKELLTYNSICCVLPCRSGKSYIMLEICENANLKGSRVLILAHRNILLNQHKKLVKTARIESVFTEINHLGDNPIPDIIIIDEAHISGCESYNKVCEYYKSVNPRLKIIGFTATPSRLDGQPLSLFQKLIIGISANELIELGNISQYDLYAPKLNIDLSKVNINGGDYNQEQLGEVMCDNKIYGDILDNYLKYAEDKQAIAYCVNVKHSQSICDLFNIHNIKAVHIDSHTPIKDREQVMEDFKNGKFQVLCNCNLISEGITLPTCECCLLLRPTQSLALYIQQACRCLTPVENKKAVIIDYVGNCYRHGMPTENREWSLEKKVKCHNPSGTPELLTRECGFCFRIYKGRDRICPYCGKDNGKTKKEIEQEQQAELERITEINRKQKRQEVGMARTKSELLAIAKARGYNIGWVYKMMKVKHIH